MIAVVTGAAGFLGSHLVGALLREGHTVVGLDDLSTGTIENVAPFLEHSAFRFIEADVALFPPSLARIDAIFHFASAASPVDYAQRPIATLRVNSVGTEQCCRLAHQHEARLIFASTSEIYGDPAIHPQPETYNGNVNPIGPRSCYDEGKRFGEAMIAAYVAEHRIDARVLRIFNTYGPRMRRLDGRVVPAFIGQALRKQPFTIYGNGLQTRSLCYVDDLIEGILRYSMIDDPLYRVMNLGGTDERSVREIAQLIAELCDVPFDVDMRPLPLDDPKLRRPDLERARTLIHWTPQIDLEEGLRRTIAWFRQPVRA